MIPKAFKVSRQAWAWSLRAYGEDVQAIAAFRRHLRWAAASAMRQALAHRWFAFLEAPRIKPFLDANPRLAFAPMGAYLSADWGWPQRIQVLRDSYTFAAAQGGALETALLRPEGVILAQPGSGKEHLAVRLRSDAQFRKEGVWGVFLEMAGIPGDLSGFAFSLRDQGEAGWTLLVGAVQGRSDGGEGPTRGATKAMHGLMPKRFMVFLAQEIARSLRVKALLGAGNTVQINRARPGRKRVLFDYDALWEEAGGSPEGDGWFRVPLRGSRREAEAMKPNKRGMYARRYVFLDDVARQIRIALTLPSTD